MLLGDPQQLRAAVEGQSPRGRRLSALQHLLAGEPVISSELGRFLDVTWRMHPAVCEFVSQIAYEGRLHSKEGLERQSVDGFAGLRWIPVEEAGNRSWSAAEVRAVDELVRSLVGKRWTDADGVSHEMTLDDILVVTPYNAQVAKLAAQLPDGARVGTVDKFQGQEAPVSIYSMATSSADDVPRSLEFLYDLHRFNVAVSRAKAESVVVCSPELLEASCRNPVQMKLVNALCFYGGEAAGLKGEQA
ncbi:MAG: C-terminal helicase domain-containing protein [Acidimicrobiia bacterium]